MCIVSMVHDYYWPKIPKRLPWINPQPVPFVPWPQPPAPEDDAAKELKDLEKILKDYRKAVEAAKQVDKLTNQPDCVDPEKAVAPGVASDAPTMEALRRFVHVFINELLVKVDC